jgi:hypothetical protein
VTSIEDLQNQLTDSLMMYRFDTTNSVCTRDNVCDSLIVGGANGTCHKSTLVVNQNFMQCQVTSEFRIGKATSLTNLARTCIQTIPDEGVVKNLKKSAEVTFTCDRKVAQCDFQFWVAGVESFYCHMSDCQYSGGEHFVGTRGRQSFSAH